MSRHKPQYTFAQLINTVEDLKKLYEEIRNENEMYREHTKRLEERLECVESHCKINSLVQPKRPKPGGGFISIKTPEKINGLVTPEFNERPRIKEVRNGKPGPVPSGGIRVKAEFSEVQHEDDSFEEEALAELMEVQNDLLKIENDETLEFPDIEHQNNASQFQAQVSTKMETFDLSDLKISRVKKDSVDIVSRIEHEISAKIQGLGPGTKIEPVKVEPGEEFENGKNYEKPTTRDKRPKRQSTEAANKPTENGKQRKINETIKNYNDIQSEKSQAVKSKTRNNKPPSKFDKFEMDEEQVDEAIEEQSKNVIEVKKRTSPTKKVKVYCKCKSTYTKNSPMIGCDGPCQDWYHFDCVGIPQNFRSIAEWYCEECFFKITNGSIEVCLCGGWFEPAHELVRCKSICKKLYHPGCLGLDNANMVTRWEEERAGKCGYCNS
eukprot:GFUD01003385.1.p1 GENE.GFUD01003385.1~~GFUD01003385.1.p1  ORF type:complete len:437 (+),score=135.90 GFUD01003385.1:313-1623(+)